MALFGNKDDDKKKGLFTADDVDERLLAALEEAETELEQDKAEALKVNAERRKQQNEAREAAAKEKQQNEGRRAYLMVKSVETGEDYVVVKGNLGGEIHVGDTAYVYRPSGTVVEVKIGNITPDAEEIRRIAEIKGIDPEENKEIPDSVPSIQNSPVELQLMVDTEKISIPMDKIAPEFSVVSLVPPLKADDKKKPAENTALMGLTFEYKHYNKEKEFMNFFLRGIITGNFLVPLHNDGTLKENGKPNLKLITVQNKDGNGTIPVFTDFATLSLWKTVFDEQHKPTAVLMTFPEIVKVASKDNLSFTINVAGPVAIEVPRALIDVITNSEGYKRRFGEGNKPKYRKEVIRDASKIFVGELPNVEECKIIREAFKKYGATNSSISSIGILAMRRDRKNSYLVIVDCPKDVSREIFADLLAIAKPHMKAVKDMNFSLYSETVFADQYFSEHAFDYVKNPNA